MLGQYARNGATETGADRQRRRLPSIEDDVLPDYDRSASGWL